MHKNKKNLAIQNRLYNEGLIYREEKLVNWCGALQTTISDVEVETKLIDEPKSMEVCGYEFPVLFGMLHKFAYKLQQPTGRFICSFSGHIIFLLKFMFVKSLFKMCRYRTVVLKLLKNFVLLF